ncbi:hypothetical protein EV06_0441 [Prochlorococcus sp. MIT 0602]|nr:MULTISPECIES: L-threonylcarbamoyladenylate synthase [unclassified Prochlorococcus]KGG16599.1 hypothetical protein EV06_0441 [Prochlorococcus sp. MIT 0602]KGG18429.1 hypothetical protein EV07_0345 [Prochlorococcus sp. MIT 0603]
MQIPIFLNDDLLLLLKEGSPVLIPTDTLPALAACPENASCLWKIKNRPMTKPFILMGSSSEKLLEFVMPEALEDAFKIGSAYWPGALTIVVPAVKELVDNLNPFGSSIGMRVPACDFTINFLEKSGPLATTSANISGHDPLLDPKAVSKCFPQLPLLGPLPWPKPSGQASTLIEWKAPGSWQILRIGAVIPLEVEQ